MWKVVVLDRRAWLAGLLAAALARPAAALTLDEAIGRLARERTFAEEGAGLLKLVAEGDLAMLVDGQRLYAQAKARFGEVLAALQAATVLGDEAAVQRAIEAPLTSAIAQRLEFSRHVEAEVDEALAESKAVLVDALAASLGDLVTALTEVGIEIWKELRRADETRRSAIIGLLGDLAWKPFNAVPAG